MAFALPSSLVSRMSRVIRVRGDGETSFTGTTFRFCVARGGGVSLGRYVVGNCGRVNRVGLSLTRLNVAGRMSSGSGVRRGVTRNRCWFKCGTEVLVLY